MAMWLLALVVYGGGLRAVRKYQNEERFNLAMYRSVGRNIRCREIAEQYQLHYLRECYWAGVWKRLASIPATVGAIGVVGLTIHELTYWLS